MRPALVFALVFSLTAYAGSKGKAASGSKHSGAAAPAATATTAGKHGIKEVKLKPVEDAPSDSAPQASGAPPTRGPTRIDFDDRLIQGQTNKSGAVYLYDRKELKQRSMIKTRDSFRDEIVNTVYDG